MSNIIERKNAPRQGKNASPKPGGKFVAAMSKLAKKHSANRSKSPIQVGNVLTKKAPQGGPAKFTSNQSGIEKPGVNFKLKDQIGLNPEQPGDE